MVRYKCPECGEYEMEKQVYTECFCKCGFVNHNPHLGSHIKEKQEEKRTNNNCSSE